MENQGLEFSDLRLLPGQVLQLEFDSKWLRRERSVLVGYSYGRSIIVTSPATKGVSVSVPLGINVNVRLFSSSLNGACAFRCTTIYATTRPFPHLHLSMPDQMEMGEIRKSIRASVELIAAVSSESNNDSTASIIHDLSTDGARIGSTQLRVQVGEKIVVSWKCTVAGIDRLLSIPGTVRTVSEGENETFFGIEFDDVDEVDRVMLHAFVLSSLHKPPVSLNAPPTAK